jgi:hypothetical protein
LPTKARPQQLAKLKAGGLVAAVVVVEAFKVYDPIARCVRGCSIIDAQKSMEERRLWLRVKSFWIRSGLYVSIT